MKIPAVHADPVTIPEETIGGRRIPAVTIPGVDLPAQRVPAQCVDFTEAPGGCLGAVSIPPTAIPPATIPAVEIPGVRAPGIELAPVRAESVTAPSVRLEGASTGEVCQAKPSREGESVAGVYRPGIYRPGTYRPGVYRKGILRPGACNSARECIRPVTVPMVSVPMVALPMVSVPMVSLRGYTAGKAQVFKGDGTVAYDLKADVLFDFGRADIKPDAVSELKSIAASIKKDTPADGRIHVDGHTDAKGGDAVNQSLSERRARAIVEWLAEEGGFDRERLQATGYGETKPVAGNVKPDGSDDADGRARNRRVVIWARQE